MLAGDLNISCYRNNVSTIYELWIYGQFHKAFDSQKLAVAAYRLLNEPDSFIREVTEVLRDYRMLPKDATVPSVNPPKADAAGAYRMVN